MALRATTGIFVSCLPSLPVSPSCEMTHVLLRRSQTTLPGPLDIPYAIRSCMRWTAPLPLRPWQASPTKRTAVSLAAGSTKRPGLPFAPSLPRCPLNYPPGHPPSWLGKGAPMPGSPSVLQGSLKDKGKYFVFLTRQGEKEELLF